MNLIACKNLTDYNMLIHYADFMKAVVSDVPDDIYLDNLKLDDEQKELIIAGLPMVKNCVESIYDSVIEYAGNPSLPRKNQAEYQDSGELMQQRREARTYMSNLFYSFYIILSKGEYDELDCSITVLKEYLTQSSSIYQKFRQVLLIHIEHFCRIEYHTGDVLTDWRKCDNIKITFDDKALCYTLWHMIQNKVNLSYFQYGDFRMYSKSGQIENMQNNFPDSVRLKALGKEKYNLYQTLCNKTREILNIEQTGENTYQGHGFFMILNDYGNIDRYKNKYENTRISLRIQKDKLTVDVRPGFEAFGKLPEIFEKLTPNIQVGFLKWRQCTNCSEKCKRKRIAVFDESVSHKRTLYVCMGDLAACDIENNEDINSIILIYEHIKKYTETRND